MKVLASQHRDDWIGAFGGAAKIQLAFWAGGRGKGPHCKPMKFFWATRRSKIVLLGDARDCIFFA